MIIVVSYRINTMLLQASVDKGEVSSAIELKDMSIQYAYKDKAGKYDCVQIKKTDKSDKISATIDFRNIEQYKHFSCPDWLTQLLC